MAFKFGTLCCMGLFEWNAGNLPGVCAGLLHFYKERILHTSLFLAEPSNITSMQLEAMTAHKFSRTFTLGLLSCLQKTKVTAMVIRTANSEMEQPIIDMISKAFLLGNEVFKKT